MSMGYGSVYSSAKKQKLVTCSSTGCELVGVHDVMPQLEWTRLFLDAQGYQVQDTILYQDNKSVMLLERNGRASSSRRTKHIHLRYFYVKDRVDACAMQSNIVRPRICWLIFLQIPYREIEYNPSSPYHSSSHRSVLKGGNDLDDQNGLDDRTE
jgi:hypothetical protein